MRAAAPAKPERVKITNPDKVFWPDEGYTKGDLVDYYTRMAPVLLPHLRDRPFVMRQFPNGIQGKSFYRWQVPGHAPEWLERWRYSLQTEDREIELLVVDDLPELTWVANQGVIEIHPWLSRKDRPDRPDRAVFDLDPGEGRAFADCLRVALWVREALEKHGLSGHPKTSGGKGVHVFVALERRRDFDAVRGWVRRVCEELVGQHPSDITIDKAKPARRGKVLIDYSQNAIGKSTVTAYSVRAKPGAPVSMPLTWDEVARARVRPQDFTLRTAPQRLQRLGDLFGDML